MTNMVFKKVTSNSGAAGLLPLDRRAQEFISRTKDGQQVLMSGRRPRNLKHHNKFFAMLDMVAENCSTPVSPDELLEVIKLGVGHVKRVKMPFGIVEYAASIDFASMDQLQFDRFWDLAIPYICIEIIPGMVPEELEQAVLEEIAA